MKYVTCLLFLILFSCNLRAQDSTLIVSAPIDISKEGWNKVLQLSNGNTMLFHFELKRHTIVKVFDKKGKEIASTKFELTALDVTALDRAQFEGLYDINGEAVLFATQQIDNVVTLVRIRINPNTGMLVSEDKLIKSQSFARPTFASVKKMPWEQDYAIFTYDDPKEFLDTILNAKLLRYNNRHEKTAEIPIPISIKGFDYIQFLDATMDNDGGIMACFEYSKTIQEGHLYERTLGLISIPTGSEKVYYNTLKMPSSLKITAAEFTLNPFLNNINLITNNQLDVIAHNGIEENELVSTLYTSAYIFPVDFSGVKMQRLDNDMASKYLQTECKDSTKKFEGIITHLRTNERGLSTIIFEEIHITNASRQVLPSIHMGNIAIVNYDDNFKEISTIVFPKSHHYSPTQRYPSVFGQNSHSELFETYAYIGKKSHYILVNDVEDNFNKTLADKLLQPENLETTNTFYYHVGKKNKVTKTHFFNTSTIGEYNAIFPRSAHFNELDNQFAVLYLHTKGKEATLHLAWRKMED